MWSEFVSNWMFISTQAALLSVQFLAITVLLLCVLIDEFVAHAGNRRNRSRQLRKSAGRVAQVVPLSLRG
jgi:hypothetical protein